MIGLYADVPFALTTYFEGIEQAYEAQYAEIARIGQKPLLQFTGYALDTFSLDMLFHVNFCEPQDEIDKLIALKDSRSAGGLVLDNGRHAGWFVLTNLSVVATQTTPDGALVQAAVKCELKEAPPADNSSGNLTGIKHPAAAISNKPKDVLHGGSGFNLAKALSTGKTALQGVQKGLALAKALQSGNPLRALNMMPSVAKDALKGASALGLDLPITGDDVKYLTNMTKSSSALASIGQLAQGADASNLVDRLTAMQGHADMANRNLSAASPFYANNIANMVARQ